jgi:FtsZ-binding cell division protein ZapB
MKYVFIFSLSIPRICFNDVYYEQLQEIDELKEENARLNWELREARAQIRNLELQVEGIRANARKAAQALLDG